MGDYRATTRAWADVQGLSGPGCPGNQCILELRARVEALEAAQQNEEADIVDYYAALSAQHQGRAVFHDDSKPTPPSQIRSSLDGPARAAIREVAAWLQDAGHWEAADALEQEAER